MIVDGGRTTERLTDQDLMNCSDASRRKRNMRFLTGKPPKNEKDLLRPVKKLKKEKLRSFEPGIIKPLTKGGQNKA